MPLHLQYVRSAIAGIAIFLLLFFLSSQTFTKDTSSSPAIGLSVRPDSGLLYDVVNATLGFQKIFVINLPRRTDHRDAMSLAAAFSGLKIDYVDGVTEVDEKTLPPGGVEMQLPQPNLGNWRAHLNVARMMIEQNIASALVLEDDADWDIRIKEQMQDFARASHLLVQPVAGTSDKFLDPSYPQPEDKQRHQDFIVGKEQVSEPTTSPYGDLDRWDLLWLGHCGCRFPRASDANVPIGRAIILNDTTVPEQQHIQMQFGTDELIREYPAHTRAVSRARVNTCSLGYGISQPGARRLLYELGIHKLTGTTDMMLRSICDGSEGRPIRTCLTVQPQIFQHHRPIGVKSTFSDISEHEPEFNDRAFTKNIRWSVRLNFPMLVDGRTDYIDLFKDGEQSNVGFLR